MSRSASAAWARRPPSSRAFRPTATARRSPPRSPRTASTSASSRATRARRRSPSSCAAPPRPGSRYSFYLDATAYDGPWPFPTRMAGRRAASACRLVRRRRAPRASGRRGDAACARAHATSSFDPNIRPFVTPDREAVGRWSSGRSRSPHRQGERGGPRVALSRPLGRGEPRRLGEVRPAILRRDARRARRARHRSARRSIEVPAPRVEVVDTVGAGDSFMSALLSAMDRDHALGARGAAPIASELEALAALRRRRVGDHLHAQGLGSADPRGGRGGARGVIGNRAWNLSAKLADRCGRSTRRV